MPESAGKANERTLQSMTEAEYLRQVRRVAEHLRNWADRIEAEGKRTRQGGQPRHVMAAADVMTAIDAMHGNLMTWGLFSAADQAQKAALEGGGGDDA